MSSTARRFMTLMQTALFAGACGQTIEPGFEVGGLYSIENGDSTFGIAKVLALDPGVVGVRTYTEKFPERPSSVDPVSLSLGSINDPDGFGMGHLPITPRAFFAWKPILISVQPVVEEELEGYRIWKEADAGPLEP